MLAVLGVAGFATGSFAKSTEAAAPQSSAATSRVTVIATEFRFRLSKARVPTGTVIFTVINRGKIAHDFRIAGKKTPNILPGRRATLRVVIKKKGRKAYLCTLLGHATAGMKGRLAVGTTPAPTTATTTTATTTTTTTTTSTTTGTVGNTASTIAVGMFEYRFDLVPATVPSGPITFVITNRGQEVHNFSISGVKAGAFVNPGGSETWTVGLPPGRFDYVCDVPFHIGAGMVGTLVVTG